MLHKVSTKVTCNEPLLCTTVWLRDVESVQVTLAQELDKERYGCSTNRFEHHIHASKQLNIAPDKGHDASRVAESNERVLCYELQTRITYSCYRHSCPILSIGGNLSSICQPHAPQSGDANHNKLLQQTSSNLVGSCRLTDRPT